MDDNCGTCQLHNIQVKGGRQRKGKCLGRPPQTGPIPQTLGTSALVHDARILMQQIPSFCGTSTHLQLANFAPLPLSLSLEHFTCRICGNLLDQPVQLSCNHTFCGDCLVQQVHSGTANIASQAANATSQWGVYKSHQSSSWSL